MSVDVVRQLERDAAVWMQLAVHFQDEAASMRRALWAVVETAALRDEHFAYARDLIAERFGQAE